MSPVHQFLFLLFLFTTAMAVSALLSIFIGWLMTPKAPAYRIGWQESAKGRGFWLYNLTRDIPGHPSGSTVSEMTLRTKGYRLP
jgi:hypothetical protein